MSEYALLVLGTIFGGITALGAIATVVLMWRDVYYRPAAQRKYWPWVIAAVLITVASVPPGYLAYRLFQGYPPSSIERPVYEAPPGSARMDVSNWVTGSMTGQNNLEAYIIGGGRFLAANVYTVNRGKATALKMIHNGSILVPSAATPQAPEDVIVAIFVALRVQLSMSGPTDLTMYPDQSMFFTISDQQVDDGTSGLINNGSIHPYTIVLVRYTDETVPHGKYIYTEGCVYTLINVVHFCETGHNKTYMAD
jgi:hypothetical protein